MKTTLIRYAIAGFLCTFAPSLSAQNTLTPLQKEWFKTWLHLVKLSQKASNATVQKSSSLMPCAVSNEITIVVGPCLQANPKENGVAVKPVQ